jgi:hypothetical protein
MDSTPTHAVGSRDLRYSHSHDHHQRTFVGHTQLSTRCHENGTKFLIFFILFYLLTTVYNWHHMSTNIYVSLRYVHNAFMQILCCIYIIYDIDLVPNLGRRGHCDIVRTIDIL